MDDRVGHGRHALAVLAGAAQDDDERPELSAWLGGRTNGSTTTDGQERRGIVISLTQDFMTWQFSVDGHLPSTDDDLVWEPPS